MTPSEVLATADAFFDWDGVPIAVAANEVFCVVFDKPGGRIVRGTFPETEGCTPISRDGFDKLLSSIKGPQ